MTEESDRAWAADLAANALTRDLPAVAGLLDGGDMLILPCGLCRRMRACGARLSGLSSAGTSASASICITCLSRPIADLAELIALGGEEYAWTQQIREDLACADCPAEVRVTAGAKIRARVIHSATCPWYRRYEAREVVGCIPCGTVVTHRGPYKRDPEGTR